MMSFALRLRILEAAAQVYGAHGFRGATTRRIAEAAGVNEVTLFRIFGSKAALIDEAIRFGASRSDVPTLPAEPGDVAVELTAWAEGIHAHMVSMRAMIRTCMSEMSERPEMSGAACEGPSWAHDALRHYLHRAQRTGRVAPHAELNVVASMLMGALFSDAMGRDVMPSVYPPADEAVGAYVRVLAPALGLAAAPAATPRRGPARRTTAAVS